MEALGSYALTLATTVAVETPIVSLLALRRGWLQVAQATVCANLVSHPVATALTSRAGLPWPFVELLVVAFEAWALHAAVGLTWKHSLSVSLVANAVTTAIAIAWSID